MKNYEEEVTRLALPQKNRLSIRDFFKRENIQKWVKPASCGGDVRPDGM